ncbi:MAG: hypothetical protein PHP98_08810, partial [Kiritimatiellae bacterium]|nr:hypothetical protein [Kiritimatiellia bacterium]
LAALYIDHVNGPLTTNQDAFCYFTVATWRDAAGLDDGFWRVTAEGSNTYGYAQAGDEIGSWIFEDIRKGFSALKNTLAPISNVQYRKKSVSTSEQGGWGYIVDNTRLLSITMWGAAEWSSSGYVAISARASANAGGDGSQNYAAAQAYRDSWKVTVGPFSEDSPARQLDVYFGDQGNTYFVDVDELGLEAGKIVKIGEIPAFEETSLELDWFPESEECPWALIGSPFAPFPQPPPNYDYPELGYRGGLSYLTKWVFTYN